MTHRRTLSSALLLLLTLTLGAVALAGCGGSETDTSAAQGTVTHGAAAADPGGNIVREEFALENFRGKPLLLNFWATW